MNPEEILRVTLNIGILAIFYTVVGGIVSYLLYYVVSEHNEEWERKPTWYQLGDVSIQLASIGTFAFWITYFVKKAPPIFHVSPELDAMVDSCIVNVFFAYAMFLFLDFLDSKIKYLYHKLLETHLERMFPLRKTNKKKTT